MNRWLVVGGGLVVGLFFFVVVSGVTKNRVQSSSAGDQFGGDGFKVEESRGGEEPLTLPSPTGGEGGKESDLAMVINSGIVPNAKVGSIEEGIHSGKLIVGEGRVTKIGLPRHEKVVGRRKRK